MSEKAANNRLEKNPHEKYLVVLCWLLSFVFLISLFKNISYPLFWADESMTVMGGVRVLDFGYPKVHDGKNVLYDLRHPNVRLGIDEKTAAIVTHDRLRVMGDGFVNLIISKIERCGISVHRLKAGSSVKVVKASSNRTKIEFE